MVSVKARFRGVKIEFKATLYHSGTGINIRKVVEKTFAGWFPLKSKG